MPVTCVELNEKCAAAIDELFKKPLTSSDLRNLAEAISFLNKTEASGAKKKKVDADNPSNTKENKQLISIGNLILGKEGVACPIHASGTIKRAETLGFRPFYFLNVRLVKQVFPNTKNRPRLLKRRLFSVAKISERRLSAIYWL